MEDGVVALEPARKGVYDRHLHVWEDLLLDHHFSSSS